MTSRYPFFLFLFCLTLCFHKKISGQIDAPDHLTAFERRFYPGLKYRCIGPVRGGRSTAVTGIPGAPYTFYMGSTGGGVWKTTDAGQSWKNISDHQITVGSIGAIAVAPANPDILYVGTGSACPRGNVSPGNGIYISRDGGENWMHTGLPNAGQIAKVVIHPRDPDVAYAAVLGNVFGAGPERGIYKTTDGGGVWQKMLYINDTTGACDLVMHPTNPNILFAGMWTVQRKPWTLVDGSTESGIWKSRNGGQTWQRVNGGLPEGIGGRPGITISPANPKRLWVIQETRDEAKGGVYRSDDGGKTWEKVNREHKLRQRAWYYAHIYADPIDENTVYVLNVNMHKSIDGGKTFSTMKTPHGDNHDLWINPEHPGIMVEANDGGATVSLNGGKTWSTQYNQPTAEMYRVTVDNRFPYRVYGAQQDNTTISVESKPSAAITPQQHWYAIGGGESGHIAVHPEDPDIVFAGNYIGIITSLDRRQDLQRNVTTYPQMHDGMAPRDIRYRFQWNAPIRISPHDPDILYHCSQYVHRSTDMGLSWEIISPDLTTNEDAWQDIPGGPVQHDHTGVELYTTIFAFEESPHEKGVLWAGSDDGLLHLSRDNGQSWQDITPQNLPQYATINCIDLSAHGPGRAIVTAYQYRENDFRPYIFLTDDYGTSWTSLADGRNGIPQTCFARVVREDPLRKGLLFAGTEFGMFVSHNTGKDWNPLQLNLPYTPITDMVIKENDLVVATQGRSFWILDDITPLRQIGSESAGNVLYAPLPAYRTQLRNSRGNGAPDEAPLGATIYFSLQKFSPASDTVILQITKPETSISVRFSSHPAEEIGDHELEVDTGLHRVVWDLHFPEARIPDDAVFSLADTDGPKAPPGNYGVVLKVGKDTFYQKLRVLKDPRWAHPDADLRAQFDLALQCFHLLEEIHSDIALIRSARKQIKAISQRKDVINLQLDALIAPVVLQLEHLENDLIQTKSESRQDPINYPPKLNDQIAYLYSIVNNQDARPTQGCYERLEDLRAIYMQKKKTLGHLENAIAQWNATLIEKGISIIEFKTLKP